VLGSERFPFCFAHFSCALDLARNLFDYGWKWEWECNASWGMCEEEKKLSFPQPALQIIEVRKWLKLLPALCIWATAKWHTAVKKQHLARIRERTDNEGQQFVCLSARNGRHVQLPTAPRAMFAF